MGRWNAIGAIVVLMLVMTAAVVTGQENLVAYVEGEVEYAVAGG